MPQKGLKKGDGAWGSGKKLSSKVFFCFPKYQPLLGTEQILLTAAVPIMFSEPLTASLPG